MKYDTLFSACEKNASDCSNSDFPQIQTLWLLKIWSEEKAYLTHHRTSISYTLKASVAKCCVNMRKKFNESHQE